MSGPVDAIVDAISGSSWSYVIVFLIAAIDAFFPLVPSEATAIAAGVVAGAGDLNVVVLIAAAALGAIVGDNICFALGHFLGDRIVNRFFTGEKSQERLAWAQRTLDERGGYLIVVARFIPGGRTVDDVHGRVRGDVPVAPLPLLRRHRRRSSGGRTRSCSATSAARRSRRSPGRGSSSRSGSPLAVTAAVEAVSAPAGSTGRPPLSPRSRMPRCAMIAAVTSTKSASKPCRPWIQPLAGSSSGGSEEDLHRARARRGRT